MNEPYYKITVNDEFDLGDSLTHHGVDGMKWGVWNEETKQKYGTNPVSDIAKRIKEKMGAAGVTKESAAAWKKEQSEKAVAGGGGSKEEENKDKSEQSSSDSSDLDRISNDVIRGDYGNGQERVDRLTAAGYDYDTVQSRVNDIIYGRTSSSESSSSENDDIANDVIRGDYGNGQERVDRLTAAGYDYDSVQNRVNDIIYGRVPEGESASESKAKEEKKEEKKDEKPKKKLVG